ncbi:hypothetical protein B0A48_04389 [Cryoendolithus antarcticus]|uniref:Uncharacterized protein n=1 Tax=Cryoendolithus antarcticus TaxID=1507870 RepID=A0A1V8TF82_9PEZI|nr:hypothetical protein B0A48_04389 [Cryoendolithus antarcticus]
MSKKAFQRLGPDSTLPGLQHLAPHRQREQDDISTASSDLVHLSNSGSRQPSPFEDLPHPDDFAEEAKTSITAKRKETADQRESSDFDILDEDYDPESGERSTAMPSDLRAQRSSQPLLPNGKREGYLTRSISHTTTRSQFRERDSEELAKLETRKRYTYAAIFLLISLFAFAVQTETAVYIQHNLGWKKPYCMLYFTHGSWTLLWPTQLLMLRLQKWRDPWPVFWRRHVAIIRSTAQMIEHGTLHIPPDYQKKSPWPYFIRTTSYVTCALTVAGGSWYLAVDLTTASDLTAIYNCSAFFAYAFAIPMLGEHLRWSKVFAVGVAIAGVLIVAYGDTASTAKHGSKSGGGTGGNDAPVDSEASNRFVGNLVIGVGSVLYGFYEVLYKKVACPPDGCSPGRGMLFANTFGSMIGIFTLSVLWIPLPILHFTGIEIFELPQGRAAWMLLISVLANATFSGSFLVLISLTSPVLSSVAALLTIFLVALCDELLPEPLHNDLSAAAVGGGVLIIAAFALLSWATFREMREESLKHAEDIAESDVED